MHRAVLALLLCSAAVAHAGVYKWTDANGKVHYGDQPPTATDASKPRLTAPSGFAETNSGQSDKQGDTGYRPSSSRDRKQQLCQEMQSEYEQRNRTLMADPKKDEQRARNAKEYKQNREELGCL